MSIEVRGFLKARRDRALGSILGFLEDDFRQRMTREEWEEVRGVVLDAINGYHDAVLDLMKSDDGMRNEEVVALLQRLEIELRNRRVRS